MALGYLLTLISTNSFIHTSHSALIQNPATIDIIHYLLMSTFSRCHVTAQH